MDRLEVITAVLIDLVDYQIITLDAKKILKWAKLLDAELPDKTTGNDVKDFCHDFIIGNKQWVRPKGISNILTFPLRNYTPEEIQARKIKLGID